MIEELTAARGITWTRRRCAYEPGSLSLQSLPVAPVGVEPERQVTFYEFVLTIGDLKQYLWRAVEQEGFVLDALAKSRLDSRATKRIAHANC